MAWLSLWAAVPAGWLRLAGYLLAESSDAPVGIVAAFITLSAGLGGLVGWTLKNKFAESKEERQMYAAQSERLQGIVDRYHEALLGAQKLAEQAVATFRDEVAQQREHQAREREQYALLADEQRKRRQQTTSREEGHS
jgi:hypothetical protein